MTGEDSVELVRIKDSGFDELEDAGEILGATELKREGDQVLGSHDPGGDGINLGFDGPRERLFAQGVAGGKELDLPAFNDDVFPFDRPAAGGEILVNRGKGEQGTAVAGFEGTVAGTDLRYTTLEAGGKRYLVPNATVLNSPVTVTPAAGQDT